MPVKKRPNILFGEALRELRKRAGISQEDLAFEAKLDRTYISHLENGHKSPTLDVILRISPVLGVAASELVGRVEQLLQTRRK